MSEAIYMWDTGGLNVAVPKQRGEGYLKVPLGHHPVPALDDIENAERIHSMSGLDGYLWLEYGYVDFDKRQAIVDRVLPKLAAHFKFTAWREDTKAFWKIVMPKTK